MKTSSNGNIFRVTGLFRGIHRSPVDTLAKAIDAELWCFLWSAPEQTVEQTMIRRWFEPPSRSLWRRYNVYSNLSCGDAGRMFTRYHCFKKIWKKMEKYWNGGNWLGEYQPRVVSEQRKHAVCEYIGPNDEYMRQGTGAWLVWTMAWRRKGLTT